MNQESTSRQYQSGQDAAEKPAASPSLPDLNAETYPFEFVQHLLDQAAYFNMLSTPDPHNSDNAIMDSGERGGVIGIRVNNALRRFDVMLQPPSLDTGLKAADVVGERVGKLNHHWMIIPDDYEGLPGQDPPPVLLDPSRSQRFIMLDGLCTFGNGENGFRGFGAGHTTPAMINGQPHLLAGAVGNIMEGFGKLTGLEGTYTFCGSIDAHSGFSGELMCRIVDPKGSLSTEADLPTIRPTANPETGITYIVFRGQKRDATQKTTYSFGPDGQVDGLNVQQQLRLFHIDFTQEGRGSLRGAKRIGQVIGNMASKVFFNLFNPGAPGTATGPIPFRSLNEFTFIDRQGRSIGSVVTEVSEGRTFNMKLSGAPGQTALRFGGFGRILSSTGQLEGMEGLAVDNSVVGVAPHAISGLYVLRINDPEGKYRAAINDD